MRLDRRAACRVGGGVLAIGLAVTSADGLATASAAPVRVLSVSPSGAVVPENLLRLSVRFDAPPPGRVLARLALLGRHGRPLPEPFLEQELWSPDGLTLTVLLHPGRGKTGLFPRQAWGPIPAAGAPVSSTIVPATCIGGTSTSAKSTSSRVCSSRSRTIVASRGLTTPG